MGDRPLGASPTNGASYSPRVDGEQNSPTGHYEEGEGRTEGLHARTQQSQQHSTFHSSQQYAHHQQPSPGRIDTFNMNPMSAALPDASYQNYGAQRYPPAPSPGLMYPGQNLQQFPGAQNMVQTGHMPYAMPYQHQYPGVYNSSQTPSPPHFQVGSSTTNQYYNNQGYMGQQQQQQQQQQQHMAPQYYVPPNQYSPQGHMYSGMPSPAHYGSRGSFPAAENRYTAQQRSNEYLGISSNELNSGRQSSVGSGSAHSSVVRGPPRKPRQSGHAIWIGNLPPQTELMNLVLHVCKEAPGLESLFLISKSNCAFANFKDETSCAEAQAKIHDSKFQTVRLVSRLRRSSVPLTAGVAASISPAALIPPLNPPVARSPSPDHDLRTKEPLTSEVEVEVGESRDNPVPTDKFFIVKSLTVEDLELSVRNGIWATQSHNEEALNKAYQSADNVYLVFSANKSGEYFGYARMISPLNNDPAAAIEFAPMAQTVEDPELPKAIPTPATEFSPKGRIIDDSARGTIFWEAEKDDDEEDEETDSNKSEGGEPSVPSKAWGKPFKIEWVSTTRLPFYRTRGLRNPWNSNREVKIARDGTELETAIGRRLLALFHRTPSPITQQSAHMQGYSLMHPLV